jgi:hypothetical protein
MISLIPSFCNISFPRQSITHGLYLSRGPQYLPFVFVPYPPSSTADAFGFFFTASTTHGHRPNPSHKALRNRSVHTSHGQVLVGDLLMQREGFIFLLHHRVVPSVFLSPLYRPAQAMLRTGRRWRILLSPPSEPSAKTKASEPAWCSRFPQPRLSKRLGCDGGPKCERGARGKRKEERTRVAHPTRQIMPICCPVSSLFVRLVYGAGVV